MELNRFNQLLESSMGNVKPLIMEQPTETKMGTFDDDQLLMTACRSWSRMDQDGKTKYKNWSKSNIGKYSYDPDVACKSKASVSIGSDGDRKMLKAIIDLDFL